MNDRKTKKAVDLFAGAGGSTQGLEAIGLQVVWAANHNELACRVHQANHPTALHVCQDLHQADWRQVPAHELLWASPACQGHSQAASRGGSGKRGSAPAHDALRSTAWAVVSAAEVHRPKIVCVENVPEFRSWVLYQAWQQALKALGYAMEEVIVNAADLGVPQERRRLFVVGVHGRTAVKLRPLEPVAWRSAREILELDGGDWRSIDTVPAGHQSRIEAAIKNYGHEGAAFTQAVTGHPGRSLSRPLPSITTKHQMGIVKRSGRSWVYRPLTLLEYARGMGFPDDYNWLGTGPRIGCQLVGNAVVPVVASWVGQAAMEAA